MTEPSTERPEYLQDEHLEYLDQLQREGVTNMLGAGAYLMQAYENLDTQEARTILVYWMQTYSERHPN